jgi:hypothetical protein
MRWEPECGDAGRMTLFADAVRGDCVQRHHLLGRSAFEVNAVIAHRHQSRLRSP